MNPVRIVARPMLGAMFIAGGMDAFRQPEPRARVAVPVIDLVRMSIPWAPRDPVAMVRANAAMQVAAGGMLLLAATE